MHIDLYVIYISHLLANDAQLLVYSSTSGCISDPNLWIPTFPKQGVSAEAVPPMARAVGHALSRYGHVIFPQNVHEPALQLAHRALELVGGDWASRVFFTDNGSTAIEVALKMAFRKYMVDHGILEDDSGVQLEVLGLADAYHGDTLGAMDAVAPSPYNGRKQTPWFTGRGLFLDAPTVGLQGGDWKVMLPDDMLAGSGAETVKTAVFKSLDDVFSNASAAPRAEFYRQQIEARMQQHLANNPATALGACIMEPVLQGAGGMQLIDPEFQRAMAAVCKAHGIPLIVDEVFTGFWRLGHPSGASLLGITPDIACYAKLLTGGVVPMALTLATDAVFRSFEGNSKAYALLHGHSYTAHPVGCSAALQALATFTDPGVNANLCSPGAQGRCQNGNQCTTSCSRLLPLWDEERVQQLSRKEGVERIVALGTVLAVELKASATGYTSNAAVGVVAELRQRGVFTRPLGNVVYVMVTPMTSRKQCNVLLTALEKSLEAAS